MNSYISKYHKEVGFKHINELKSFINKINGINKIIISLHAKIRITEKINKNDYYLLHDVFTSEIYFNDVIEYTCINDKIQKILIRKAFNNENDIVLSINENKCIITVFINNKNDHHNTLTIKEYSKI